jgi:hypothetical protein
MHRVIDELRAKLPGLRKRELAGHPRAAIRFFCLECMGGSAAEVKRCTVQKCALYPHRFGKREDITQPDAEPPAAE